MISPLIVAFGDLHFPWVHQDALDAAFKIAPRDATHVFQVGDLRDQYAASRFPRSHNLMTPEAETTVATEMAQEFWARCRKHFPNAKLVQIMGNHDDRPFKRVAEKLPELEHLVKPALRDLYTFPGVTTVHDSSSDYEVGNIVVHHGYLNGPTDHAKVANKCVIRGHSHKGKVTWVRPGLWELDCGYLGDPKAPVFGYSAWKRAYQMTRGLGIVDALGPRFCPLE